MIRSFTFIYLFLFNLLSFSQTAGDFVAKVKLDSLIKTVREFSGEDSCFVGGTKVNIINRVSSSGNDLAADYIVERLNAIGVTVVDDVYSIGGRNVYATKLGTTHPDSVIIIGGHYDAVADYCADDNASAVGIMIEAARILSQYQFKKTIIYAFWDEEETGLLGSKHHALQVNSSGDKVIGVLNIDMAAYDANDDGIFDIDLNLSVGSVKMKDDLIAIRSATSLNISPMVVQPGTFDSDHSSFWTHGYSAVLLGESWETNDQNSKYHTSEDRISLFNLPYYHEIAKLAIAYLGQTAEPVTVGTQNEAPQEINTWISHTTNYLSITTSSIATLELFNMNGQLLMHEVLDSNKSEINLGEIASGVYLVKVTSVDGQVFSKKITCN